MGVSLGSANSEFFADCDIFLFVISNCVDDI